MVIVVIVIFHYYRVPIGLLIVSVLSLIWIYVLPDPGVEFYKEVLIISN